MNLGFDLFEELLQHGAELVDDGVVPLAYAVRHAGFYVVLEQLAGEGVQRGLYGRDLHEHVDAVGVALELALHAADLALDARKAVYQRAVFRFGAVLYLPCVFEVFGFTAAHSFFPLKRRALPTTQTLERLIASAPIMGLSRISKKG